MATKHMKIYSSSLIIRKYKLKSQDATIHLLQKSLTIPSVGEDVKQLDLLYIASRNGNDTIKLENNLEVSLKVKYIPTT